jgi:hypothetical protein
MPCLARDMARTLQLQLSMAAVSREDDIMELPVVERIGAGAFHRGLVLFGPAMEKREALAVAVAAYYEETDRDPDVEADELGRAITTRVLNTMRDEARFQHRYRSGDMDDWGREESRSMESRVEAGRRVDWLREELERLSWADRRFLRALANEDGLASHARVPGHRGAATARRTWQRLRTALRRRASAHGLR